MIDIRTLFRSFYPSGIRTLYVSESGSDSNTGLTLALAKSTIQAAIDVCAPGDRILVGTGTYDYAQFYGKVGTAQKWITLENISGTYPVIDASDTTNDGIDIQVSSFVAIYGLEIRASQTQAAVDPSGVGIFRGSHHIAIWSCDIHDFPGGGINCFYIASTVYGGQTLPAGGWDNVDVFFNTIHGTSKYSTYNTSGISFYGAQNITGSLTDNRYAYRVVGNYIYDVICTVPYTPGGINQVTDGNGISPDSLAVPNSLNPGLAPYLKRGLIEGNLIMGCGGRGVHIYNTKNVDVINNTLIGNLRTNSTVINGSSEIDLQLDTADANNGVVITNNVIAPLNTAKTLDTTAQTITTNTVLGGTDTITGTNEDQRTTGLGWFTTTPTAASILTGISSRAFTPVAPTSVSRVTGTLGYQATALGGRGFSTLAVGALEVYIYAIGLAPSTQSMVFTDNGNGTYTAVGSGVTDLGDGTFTLNGSNIIDNGNGTFSASNS